MRLFIAIPLPEPVRRRLAHLTAHPVEGVRWQELHQLHITLKFLGEADGNKLQPLVDVLSQVHQPAFEIKIKGIRYFPKGGRPKILWLGISNTRQLTRLHHRIEEKCIGLGFEPEDRPYKPHITLGRVGGLAKRDVMSFISQHKQLVIPEVRVSEFVLYESKLRPGGAVHEKMESFPLGPG